MCIHSYIVSLTVIPYCPASTPPPFATLASVQNAGGGLYAGCDDFSRDYTPPSGTDKA